MLNPTDGPGVASVGDPSPAPSDATGHEVCRGASAARGATGADIPTGVFHDLMRATGGAGRSSE